MWCRQHVVRWFLKIIYEVSSVSLLYIRELYDAVDSYFAIVMNEACDDGYEVLC